MPAGPSFFVDTSAPLTVVNPFSLTPTEFGLGARKSH